MSTTTADQSLFIFTDENGKINFRGNIFTEEFNKYCEQLEENFKTAVNEEQQKAKTYLSLGDLLKSAGIILLMLVTLFIVAISIIIGMTIGFMINICRWIYGIFDRANNFNVF